MREKMKKVFQFCIEKWWLPLLLLFVFFALDVVNHDLNIRFLKTPILYVSNFLVLFIILSSIIQLVKSRVLTGCLSFLVLFLVGFLSMLVTMVDGDHWADDLKIPANIEIDNPIDMNNERPDSMCTLIKNERDLYLYNSGQPGMYQYDFWIDKIEEGEIYLKVFEITQEEQLSSSRLGDNTMIRIKNDTNIFKRFGSTKIFTIYEGDWGKFYAARFEVWFEPKDGSQERMLFKKNFKIQGWMH